MFANCKCLPKIIISSKYLCMRSLRVCVSFRASGVVTINGCNLDEHFSTHKKYVNWRYTYIYRFDLFFYSDFMSNVSAHSIYNIYYHNDSIGPGGAILFTQIHYFLRFACYFNFTQAFKMNSGREKSNTWWKNNFWIWFENARFAVFVWKLCLTWNMNRFLIESKLLSMHNGFNFVKENRFNRMN